MKKRLFYGIEYVREGSHDSLRANRFESQEDLTRWIAQFSDPNGERYREEISLEDIRIFTQDGVTQDCGLLV